MNKSNICRVVLRARQSRKGQTLVEYALILAFISVVAISVLLALGGQVKSVFTTVTSQLAVGANGGPTSAPSGHGG